jgi:hypothetical protein
MVFAPASPGAALKIAMTKKHASAAPVSKDSQKRKRSSGEEGSTTESLVTSQRKVVDDNAMQVVPVAEPVAASIMPSGSSNTFREPSLELDDLVSGPSKKRRR